ncbi:hypothetical protein AJ80_07237 [Polytolypa hystricis UAMH7299]|uniref:Uncharacterized protein n=1 Tax=Polytolypa hystricis (strain UAMH7299) TaxID=1447883 RepID=A0A2B7XQ92_POLH7|nr:hypothetical protein AJ80_07237 [Polytolypa hystricis UAMH7299]
MAPRSMIKIALCAIVTYILLTYTPSYTVRQSYKWTFLAVYLNVFVVQTIYSVILRPAFFSPFRQLPMPPGQSIWNGHYSQILSIPGGVRFRKWAHEIPNDGLIHYHFLLNSERLLVTSPKGIADVLV